MKPLFMRAWGWLNRTSTRHLLLLLRSHFFLWHLLSHPPPTFAGGLLSNIERFHKAKSLQSADWVDSSFGMVENHTVGWMWASYHDLYPKPSFQCLVLQVNRGSLQIGKNSPSIFLGEWQEVSSPECIWKIIDHLLLPKRCHPELTPFRNAKLSQIPKNFSQPSK